MDVVDINITSYIAAGLVVLGLIGLFALAIRYMQSRTGMRVSKYDKTRALSVREVLPIDLSQRLLLVQCWDKGYLLLMAKNKDAVVVGRNIPLPESFLSHTHTHNDHDDHDNSVPMVKMSAQEHNHQG